MRLHFVRLIAGAAGVTFGICIAATVVAVVPDPSRWDRVDASVASFEDRIVGLSPVDRTRAVSALRTQLSLLAHDHPLTAPTVDVILSRIDRPSIVSEDTATLIEKAFGQATTASPQLGDKSVSIMMGATQ